MLKKLNELNMRRDYGYTQINSDAKEIWKGRNRIISHGVFNLKDITAKPIGSNQKMLRSYTVNKKTNTKWEPILRKTIFYIVTRKNETTSKSFTKGS